MQDTLIQTDAGGHVASDRKYLDECFDGGNYDFVDGVLYGYTFSPQLTS